MLLRSERTERPRGFRIVGEVDISNERFLASLLDPEIALGGEITLDMTEVGFMDSSGIRVLLRSAARLDGRGSLVVTGVQPALRRTFDLLRVAEAPGFVIADTAAQLLVMDPAGAVPAGTRDDVLGGSHPVAEARCACGCPYLYAADDLALFWEPGDRVSGVCTDPACECHVAPLRG